MRYLELAAVLVVVLAGGLALAGVVLLVRAVSAGAARVADHGRRVAQAAKSPQQVAVSTAGRLARLADPAEIADLRLRMALRRAVVGAANAVEAAQRAGAPVGDLPDISARLTGHLAAVEQRLSMAPSSPWGQPPTDSYDSARSEAEALIAMASETHQAASDALAAVTGTTTRALSGDVADAVAGVRAAAAWLRERGTGGSRFSGPGGSGPGGSGPGGPGAGPGAR